MIKDNTALKVTPQTSGPPPFFEKYRIKKKTIGEGRVGQVYTCVDKQTSDELAVKTMYCDESTKVEIEREIKALQALVGVPRVLQLVDMFKNSTFYFLVTECLYGGELFDQIQERAARAGCLSEPEVCAVTTQLASAIQAMHEKGIVHRDLKPENVMLRSKDNVSDIVIIDLGLSREFEPGQKLTSRVGSCYYSPPEIQAKLYDESCDFWSLGIMVFVMLCSYPPFDGDDDRAVYDAVQKGTFSYKRRDWDKRSVGGPALIDQLLSLEPSKRPKAHEVLADKWIKAGTRHQEKLMRKKAEAEANGLPFVINRFGQYDQYATDAKLKTQKSKTPSQTSKELDAMNLQILNASTGQSPGELPKGTSLDGESNSNKGASNDSNANMDTAPSLKKKKGWF